DRADFLPSDTDIDAKVAELEELVAMQAQQGAEQESGADEFSVGPQPDAPDPAEKAIAEYRASIEASVGMTKYREMLGAESSFEKVFLPFPSVATGEPVWDLADGPTPEDDPKPDWMPQVTWNALGKDDNGKTLRQFVKKSAASGDPIPAFFKGQIIRTIRQGLVDELGIDWFFDTTLPDDVFVRLGARSAEHSEVAAEAARSALAEGTGSEQAVAQAELAARAAADAVRDVPTDEMWYLVSNMVADADVELVMRELLTLRGMQWVLSQAGRWMQPDEMREAYDEHRASYDGTLFPLRAIIMFKGYDSVDRYREHYRYRKSYEAWRSETMTEEELEDHYRAGGRHFFERGKVVVDLAFEGTQGQPFEQASFEQAKAKLMASLGRIGETLGEGDDVREYSFDDVMAEHPKMPVRTPQGDDRTFQRNPLRIRITESELSIFLQGYSMIDDLFYNGQRGEIFGPYAETCRRHVWGAEINAGVWVARVKNYVRGRPLAPLEGSNELQAKDDFLSQNYLYWSQECLKLILPRVKPAGTESSDG
ncbi:MAG: hypothetical protein DRQ55_09175, partial [Planctomycetota bacterium]